MNSRGGSRGESNRGNGMPTRGGGGNRGMRGRGAGSRPPGLWM